MKVARFDYHPENYNKGRYWINPPVLSLGDIAALFASVVDDIVADEDEVIGACLCDREDHGMTRQHNVLVFFPLYADKIDYRLHEFDDLISRRESRFIEARGFTKTGNLYSIDLFFSNPFSEGEEQFSTDKARYQALRQQ